MFIRCVRLKSIDLSRFDTSNVKNFQGLFEECNNLKSLNLSNFKTSKVKSMLHMFFNCYCMSINY